MSDIDKADEKYNVYQNLYSRKAETIEQEFLRNAERMARRKNGNQMYHEILSITKAEKLEEHKQKAILRDIAYEYAKRRAENNLVLGTLYDDHDEHLHYHLLISANASGESRKTRLSKAQFDKLKKEMELKVLKQYPELEQKVVINRQAEEKLSNKGAEQKRRTGKTPQRDELKAKLQTIFSQCESKEAFFDALREENLEFYVRGKTMGVKDLTTDRNHRLKTLGLLDDFQALSARIELDEVKPQQKQSTRQEKTTQSSKTKPDGVKQTSTKKETKHEGKTEQKTNKDDAVKKQQTKRKAEADNLRSQKQDSDNQQHKDKP